MASSPSQMVESRMRRLIGLLAAAGVIGLATGLAEVAILGFRKLVFDHWFHVGHHVVWLAPVGYAVLFLGIALPAAVVEVTSGWNLARPVWALLGFLSTWGIGLSIPWVEEWAILLLAVGVAIQAWRAGSRLRAWSERVILRATIPLAATVALLGVGTSLARDLAERRRIAALPAPIPGAPNILLLVLDTVGAEWLSAYGYGRPTSPYLSEFASTGVLFERAVSTAPWTLPSHGSMFTGYYPHQLKADWWVPFDAAKPALAGELARLGYLTGGFVANYGFAVPEFGLARGFVHYDAYPLTAEEVLENFALGRRLGRSGRVRRLLGTDQIANRKSAAEVNAELIAWLDGLEGRPFFAFLNYFDSHQPYRPPPPFDSLFQVPDRPVHPATRSEERMIVVPLAARRRMSLAAVEGERRAYEGTVAYVDWEIRRLMDSLEVRGLLDRTIVVITADHGESLGESGRFLHGQNLYYPVLHVPLLIRYPGQVPTGVRIPRPVSLRDLPATIVDLAGLRLRISFPGTSLAPLWRTPADSNGTVPSPVLASFTGPPGQRAWASSLVKGRFHYILYERGNAELYDIINDPLEQRNLASAPEFASVAQLLDAELRASISPGDPGINGGHESPIASSPPR